MPCRQYTRERWGEDREAISQGLVNQNQPDEQRHQSHLLVEGTSEREVPFHIFGLISPTLTKGWKLVLLPFLTTRPGDPALDQILLCSQRPGGKELSLIS